MQDKNNIAVIAFATVKPEFADTFFNRSLDLLLDACRKEEGCIKYDIHRNIAKPNEIYFYEVFASKQAFEVHKETDHVKEWLVYLSECSISDLQIIELDILE